MKFNPLNKKIRAIHLPQTGITYFSARDICKILTNGTHKSAKSYWNYIKRTDPYFDRFNGYDYIKISMLSHNPHNTRLYKTDVLTLDDVLHLIATIPHKNNKMIKLYMLMRTKKHFSNELLTIAKVPSDLFINFLRTVHKKLAFTVTHHTKYDLDTVSHPNNEKPSPVRKLQNNAHPLPLAA